MDGGRVLRAFLAHRLGYARGTQIAASIGQGAAFFFGLLGLLGGNPLLVFIALFVYLARRRRPRGADAPGFARNDRLRRHDHQVREPVADSRVEDAVQCLIRTSSTSSRWSTGRATARGAHARRDDQGAEGRGPEAPVIEVMRSDIPIVEHRRNLERPCV